MVTAHLLANSILTGFFQREISIKPNLNIFMHIVVMI